MRLNNEVPLSTAPDQLFAMLMDVERVAPCLPGASLEGRDGDSYRASVRVKVGPIITAYRGRVRFLEVDKDARRVVIDARGADQHGGGNAEARVIAHVRPNGNGSVLALETDLLISGKVAQFGRGVLGDISQKLMEQFARNIGTQIEGGVRTTPGPATSAAAPAAAAGEMAEIDAWTMLAVPVLKRVAPFAAAFAAGMALGVALGVFLRRDPA